MGALINEAYMGDGVALHILKHSVGISFPAEYGICGASVTFEKAEGGGSVVAVVVYTDNDDEEGVRMKISRRPDGELLLDSPLAGRITLEAPDAEG